MSRARGTLKQRRKTYGPFAEESVTTEAFQDVMTRAPNWGSLPPHQKVALRIIALKVARVLHGDPDYYDSWRDIAGYATLVEDNLPKGGKR